MICRSKKHCWRAPFWVPENRTNQIQPRWRTEGAQNCLLWLEHWVQPIRYEIRYVQNILQTLICCRMSVQNNSVQLWLNSNKECRKFSSEGKAAAQKVKQQHVIKFYTFHIYGEREGGRRFSSQVWLYFRMRAIRRFEKLGNIMTARYCQKCFSRQVSKIERTVDKGMKKNDQKRRVRNTLSNSSWHLAVKFCWSGVQKQQKTASFNI